VQSSGIQLSGICFAIWALHCKNNDMEAMQMGMVINKRFWIGDRRQNNDIPKVPFKDGNGSIIKECRRRIPDRRIANIQVEWIDEA
jgi:hypothetical protein